MDEINKEIEQTKTNQASDIHPSATCLLWVDDVAIITNNLPDQKRLLKITEEVANRYRISFGKDKSKTMVVGTTKESPELKINTMEIDICDHYKYLGETINSKNNIENHIKEIEKKTEAALQTVLYVAGDDNFRGIELQTIWRLLETCIIPIITYGAETWDPNKSQTKKLNTILDNILKRILRIPQSTPRECIYEEMGTLDIQHRIILKRLNYYKRLQTKQEEAIEKIITNQHTNSWTTKTKLIVTGIGLKDEDLIQQSTKEAKNNIKKAVTKR